MSLTRQHIPGLQFGGSERRGHPIADDVLDVEVALLLCHWYGNAVLA